MGRGTGGRDREEVSTCKWENQNPTPMCKRVKRYFRKKKIYIVNKHVIKCLNSLISGITKNNDNVKQLYVNKLTKTFFLI